MPGATPPLSTRTAGIPRRQDAPGSSPDRFPRPVSLLAHPRGLAGQGAAGVGTNRRPAPGVFTLPSSFTPEDRDRPPATRRQAGSQPRPFGELVKERLREVSTH